MDAYQYFYNSSGEEVGSAPVGTLEFDARSGHQHWHFHDFAAYNLLNSKGTLMVRSLKDGFCIAPTDPIDLLVANASWQPELVGLQSACGGQGALSLREALTVGWGDTYDQSRPGQEFDITDLPAGEYLIQVVANPDAVLYEVDRSNNESRRTVIIAGPPGGTRSVSVPPYGSIDAP
jgi:hypothetical protein